MFLPIKSKRADTDTDTKTAVCASHFIDFSVVTMPLMAHHHEFKLWFVYEFTKAGASEKQEKKRIRTKVAWKPINISFFFFTLLESTFGCPVSCEEKKAFVQMENMHKIEPSKWHPTTLSGTDVRVSLKGCSPQSGKEKHHHLCQPKLF